MQYISNNDASFQGEGQDDSPLEKENEENDMEDVYLNKKIVSGYLLSHDLKREEGEINHVLLIHTSRVEDYLSSMDSKILNISLFLEKEISTIWLIWEILSGINPLFQVTYHLLIIGRIKLKVMLTK